MTGRKFQVMKVIKDHCNSVPIRSVRQRVQVEAAPQRKIPEIRKLTFTKRPESTKSKN